MRCLHNLKAPEATSIYPACLICDPFRQHPPFGTEAFSNRWDILKMFDHHEEHLSSIADTTELSNHAKPKVLDRRRKHSHGYRAVHVVVEVNRMLVEIQVRTELQHLWAAWSEALADQYGQSLKYGAGPVEIQKSMMLQSEIFRLLEEREEVIAEGLKSVATTKPRSLADLASGKPLPVEVSEGMRWVGHLKKLIREKEEEKEQIAREIMKLKREKKEQ